EGVDLLRRGIAGDVVERGCDVRDVRRRRARHVASDATVVRCACEPLRSGQVASSLSVTFEAAVAIVPDALLGRGKRVRVVAGDASHRAFARTEATALRHLLDVVGVRMASRLVWGRYEDSHELGQRQTRPVVTKRAAVSRNRRASAQVTLLADILTQRW